MSDLTQRALALYSPPFHFNHGYIFDSKGHMMADDIEGPFSELSTLRVRGWGRICYMEKPQALQDALGELIAQALTEFWEREQSKYAA